MGALPTRGNPPCPVAPPWCHFVEVEVTLVTSDPIYVFDLKVIKNNCKRPASTIFLLFPGAISISVYRLVLVA